MQKKNFESLEGPIVYWVNDVEGNRPELVFLPGLTVDHRIFYEQVQALKQDHRIFVWDAPGHGLSRPFQADTSLDAMTANLYEILRKEGICQPILIGHSLGGYISQVFMKRYPTSVQGFVSLDSGPLEASSVNRFESWFMKHTAPLFSLFSWPALKEASAANVSITSKGQKQMRAMMEDYGKEAYIELASKGFRALANAIQKEETAPTYVPSLLVVGQDDRAGRVRSLNAVWSRSQHLPLIWIKDAGHNVSVDRPEVVSWVIRCFAEALRSKGSGAWDAPVFLKTLQESWGKEVDLSSAFKV